MTEALLFDYNGVITDDEEQHRASFAELLAEIGIPLSRDQYYAEYLGCDDRTAFVDVFRRAGKPLDAPTLEALVARKSQIYTRLIGAAPVLVPGVADFVRAASGRDALRDAHDQPSRPGARRRRSGVDLVRRARPGGADRVGGRVTGTPAPPPPPPSLARLEPGTVSPALVTALYTGAVMSRADA